MPPKKSKKAEHKAEPKAESKAEYVPPAPAVDFDLDKIVESLPQSNTMTGGATSKPKKTITPSSVSDDINDYIEINKTTWKNIPVDTYIRYFDHEGAWRPGARVKSIKENPDGSSSFVVGKFNPFIRKFTKWNIPFNNIATLYRLKDDAKVTGGARPLKVTTTVPQNISPEVAVQISNPRESNEEQILGQLGNKLLFEDGEIIRHKVEGIEAEVQRMNEDLKSLVVLIKRLYTRLDKAGVP